MARPQASAELAELKAEARRLSRKSGNPKHAAFWADLAEFPEALTDRHDRINAFLSIVKRHLGAEAQAAALAALVRAIVAENQTD